MKANSNKCYLIANKQSCTKLKVGNMNVENSTCEKLLGVKADNIFTFNKHLDRMIKKASRKVSVLSRILIFVDLAKRRVLTNSFFTSQFNYYPLTWMCYIRAVNDQIKNCTKDV